MSRDFHLITRTRPDAWAFARTLSEAAGTKVDVEGDFGDPDDYLHVTADGLLLEVEPPVTSRPMTCASCTQWT